MSNLDQRMAEIRRRSEKILKERKKRRQVILAACIPVILCVGLYAMIRKPANDHNQVTAQVFPENTMADFIPQAHLNGNPLSQADAQQLHLLFDQIIFSGYGLLDSNLEPDIRADAAEDALVPEMEASSTTDVVSYTIRLIMEDGTQQEYLLTGNVLTEVSTGLSTTLTAPQLQQLLDLIETM